MGSGICKATVHVVDDSSPTVWRLQSSKSIDISLPDVVTECHIKLLHLLKEPLAQQELKQFAESIGKMHLLSCWTDIEQFKNIELVDLKKEKANAIYKKVTKYTFIFLR